MGWELMLQIIGWLGSALLVFSVLQSKFLRFRILNGVASLVLVAYNVLLSSWPQVAMNAVLVVIDAYFLIRLLREQRAQKAFTFVKADADVRRWFIRANGRDIAQFHPDLVAQIDQCEGQLLFHQDRAIGLVAFTRSGEVAELLADYVIPAYRDYAPGAFVYSATGPLASCGVSTVRDYNPRPAVATYLTRMGFTQSHGVYTKQLARVTP